MSTLNQFRRRLSRRGFEPVNIAVVGTSTVWGQGADTVTAGLTARLGQVLRQRHGQTAGGVHVLPTHPGWVRGGQWTTARQDLGQASVLLQPGAYTEYTAVGTGFRLLYRQGTLVAPSFTVTVDGQPVTVNAAAGVERSYDGVWDTGVLSRGPHTVRVTAVGGTAEIGGLYVYDGDETTGVRTWCGGVPGAVAAAFTDTAKPHWRRAGSLAPAVLVLVLSSNDHAVQTEPGVFETNVRRAVALYRLAHPHPQAAVLLVHSYLRPGLGPAVHAHDTYRAVLAAVAADTPGVDMLDVSGLWPVSQVDDIDDLLAVDGVHPSTAGHAWLADLIADRLLDGPVTPVGPPAAARPVLLDPASLPGLVSAWRASDLLGADGTSVASWAPYAGSDTAPLAQASTGRQPVLRTNTVAGGTAVELRQPVAPYSTSGPYLATTAWTEPAPGPVTVVCVARIAKPYGNAWSGVSPDRLSMLILGGDMSMGMMAGVNGNGGYVPVSSGWSVYVAVYNGPDSRLFQSRHPAVQVVIPAHTAAGLGGITLGANASGGNTGNLDVAELLVYRRALSDSEAQACVAVLGARYGLDAR